MLTKNEITALNLSPTKKDFVQIWNELLEVAGKLSDRWDPTSTNESDPGIVILKALTGIADKLNYNIDKNTLEAFMPTAAQEDSMRKLCDMLGYNVKYYRSAETTVTIKYHSSEPSEAESTAMSTPGLLIPKFTVITNGDNDINYFTTNQTPYYISSAAPTVGPIPCMEGQIVKCESTADNNVITINQITENNRFYLPEYQIAENGIFVYNVTANQEDGQIWEKVDNLNTQVRGSRIFKFGYDSYRGRPYIEFPDDYSELINDGLFVYYARTSGANGNISARTLTQLELPSLSGWSDVSANSFSVENAFSATTGANMETISQAYNSFKKTVGTFETLVTCRDYMNKIYTMTDESTGKNLVSNILATDIRTDLNRAITICSCDDAGIFYKDVPLVTKTVIDEVEGTEYIDGKQVTTVTRIVKKDQAIDHFDLVLYPFKSYNQIKNNVKDIQKVYDKSFEYSSKSFSTIKNKLDESSVKAIAHNIVSPREHDILSINNYLRLNAIIGTTSKITSEEGTLLIDKIKITLANAFNMRELDFGEEIPFDSILHVIENADPRISVVSLAEPALYTTFSIYEGKDTLGNPILREYAVASDWLTEAYANKSDRFEYEQDGKTSSKYVYTFDIAEAKRIYNKLAVRNVLAGRVPLFKYNNTFKSSFYEGAYRITDVLDGKPDCIAIPTAENPFTIHTERDIIYTGYWLDDGSESGKVVYKKTYTPAKYSSNIITKSADDDTNIISIVPSCEIKSDRDSEGNSLQKISDVTLANGEYVKFRAPNFITDRTYPAYVNYRLDLGTDTLSEGEYATAFTLHSLLNTSAYTQATEIDTRRQAVLDYFSKVGRKKTFTLTKKVHGRITDKPSSNVNDFVINIENPSEAATQTETFDTVLAKSSFVKLVNKTAELNWIVKDGENTPDEPVPITAPELNLGQSAFITSVAVLDSIEEQVDEYLISKEEAVKAITADWTISFNFEYVTFEQSTLSTWSNFVTAKCSELFGFKPVAESGNVLWRVYDGGYPVGKYILESTSQKLMPFTSSHFGLLSALNPVMGGIYIAKDLGKDVKANFISNNEEYLLRSGEYLYIEYTPSTTTEDGNTSEQEPVKEVLGNGDGTIIKPSGFDLGLMDSTAYENAGNSAHKTVVFGAKSIGMHSLGANEQIAVREFARVILDGKTFASSPSVYVYKNFNNCPALETRTYSEGKRVNNTYTLKDGEYVFYTDSEKNEFAYFSSGTEVTLNGSTVFSQRDIVDIATIFDNGIDEIPWELLTFSNNDSVVLQEYQYTTIGPKDTLNSLLLTGSEDCLSATWQKCDDVTYTTSSAEQPTGLPKISVSDDSSGSGWEACSIFSLSASPSTYQTLRSTSKVDTSITLLTSPASGVGRQEEILIKAEDEEHPISFKTNLSCQSGGSELKIDDIYINPNNFKSFELKVFSEQQPAIVKTAQNKLVPTSGSEITDITKWKPDASRSFAEKGFGELWTRVPLTYLAKTDESSDCDDYALRLPVTVLPNTYGLFCIYINYATDYMSLELEERLDISKDINTWIDLLPGTSHDDITILNVPENEVTWESCEGQYERLKLRAGINCIRVNKTCDLFIKTDSGASTTSAVYFDDIRLVDCQPLDYTENGKKKSQRTQGLNLSQIGYLDTSSTDPLSSFDMQIRRKLREEYTEETIESLDLREQLEDEILSSTLSKLKEYENKLKELTLFLSNAKTEVDLLATKDEDTIIAPLFAKYKELYEDLEQEVLLRTELNNNKNIDELERRLKELLEGLDSAESIKQELQDELDKLDTTANSRSSIFTKDSLTKGAILEDFDLAAKPDGQLVNDIKLYSLKEVNTAFASKLDLLLDSITDVEDEETKNTLLGILEDLNVVKHAELVDKLEALLTVNQTTLEEMLGTAQELSAGSLNSSTNTYVVDYTALRTELVKIREYLLGANIDDILSELNRVLNSSMSNIDKYSELRNITEDLVKLINSDVPASYGNYSSLVSSIDKVLEAIQAKLSSNSTSTDVTIVSSIEALYSEVHEVYISQLNSLLTSLSEALEAINDSYSEAVNQLENTEAAAGILNNLKAYYESRQDKIDEIDGFSIENNDISDIYSEIPYGVQAVLNVWPAYMKRDFMAGVAELYSNVRAAINSQATSDTLQISDYFYSASENDQKTLRNVLANAADIAAFMKLFESTKEQLIENDQNSKRAALINDIAALISPSSGLSEALADIANDSDNYASRNAILLKLIEDWYSAATVVDKQRFMGELRSELDAVIEIDTQIVNICANLLSRSIFLPNESNISEYIDDDFYNNLLDSVKVSKEELLSLDSGYGDKLANISECFYFAHCITTDLSNALSVNDLSKFNMLANIDSEDDTSSMLPKFYLECLLEAKAALNIKSQIAKIRNSKLLKLLDNKSLVVAWQEKTQPDNEIYNWLDSYGNYYKKYTNYKNASKPKEWVAYPVNGTPDEQRAWLVATGDWVGSDGYWINYVGKSVKVEAKRSYSGDWLDDSDSPILVKANKSWLPYDEDDSAFSITDDSLDEIINTLLDDVTSLGQFSYMSDEAKSAHSILLLETQLLNDIRELDKDRYFYYNVPVEANIAIDFNESEDKLNTLMNPAINYDVNNINNNFVISKIDINYLTSGLQIARSSKLS